MGRDSGAGVALTLEGGERWYLTHTLPHSEQRAEMHLRAQGFRTCLPHVKRTIRHARQFRDVRAPLFPRYLFLILDLSRDRWLSVRSTIGVSTLFTCDGRPVPVPDGVVEAIMAHDNGSLKGGDSRLVRGQSVRILSGPFADLVGKLERLDGVGRTRVLLEIMGTVVPVAVHRGALVPAA